MNNPMARVPNKNVAKALVYFQLIWGKEPRHLGKRI